MGARGYHTSPLGPVQAVSPWAGPWPVAVLRPAGYARGFRAPAGADPAAGAAVRPKRSPKAAHDPPWAGACAGHADPEKAICSPRAGLAAAARRVPGPLRPRARAAQRVGRAPGSAARTARP